MFDQEHNCSVCDAEFFLTTPGCQDESLPSYCPFCGSEMVDGDEE